MAASSSSSSSSAEEDAEDNGGGSEGFEVDAWEGRFPYAARTSDPDALDFDRAHALFLEGIRVVRHEGNIAEGRQLVAAAYLCDRRVIIIETALDRRDVSLDVNTFRRMVTEELRSNPNTPSVSTVVLMIVHALTNQLPDESGRQTLTAGAYGVANGLLDMMVRDPSLENNPRVLKGYLTRAKIHNLRGMLLLTVANGQSALGDWTKAVELDPLFVPARLARANAWYGLKLKDNPEVYAEYRTILEQVHEDYHDLDVVYALLAHYTMIDPQLGTYEEAVEYYRKSLLLERARQSAPRPGDRAKAGRNKCLKCNKDEVDGSVTLKKCGRCKKVYYCSIECQRENFKDHKVFCKAVAQNLEQLRSSER